MKRSNEIQTANRLIAYIRVLQSAVIELNDDAHVEQFINIALKYYEISTNQIIYLCEKDLLSTWQLITGRLKPMLVIPSLRRRMETDKIANRFVEAYDLSIRSNKTIAHKLVNFDEMRAIALRTTLKSLVRRHDGNTLTINNLEELSFSKKVLKINTFNIIKSNSNVTNIFNQVSDLLERDSDSLSLKFTTSVPDDVCEYFIAINDVVRCCIHELFLSKKINGRSLIKLFESFNKIGSGNRFHNPVYGWKTDPISPGFLQKQLLEEAYSDSPMIKMFYLGFSAGLIWPYKSYFYYDESVGVPYESL